MTNLISDAFIQAKELVMKAMGELVADGTFPAEPVPAFKVIGVAKFNCFFTNISNNSCFSSDVSPK